MRRATLFSIGKLLFVFFAAACGADALAAASPLLNATQVSAGGFHTCAIVNGGVQCWGFNFDGQLGNGNYLDSGSPVPVKGLQSGVTALSAGGFHTCVIVNGGVKCWGRNPDGELGNGTVDDSNVPVNVMGLSNVVAISAGQYHTCAVISDGSVRCWGWNNEGALGNGTNAATNTGSPTAVTGVTGVSALAAGGLHTCALIGSAVKCWGRNTEGELDNGSISDSYTAVSAGGLSGATSISAGLYHTCVTLTAGTLRCWGYNSAGQLGNGNTNSTGTGAPVTVSSIASGATAVAAGGYHTCAIVSGGERCWGYAFYGQLGDNSLSNSLVPVAVSGLAGGVTAIAAGVYHSCALATVGGLHETRCWGDNVDGEMGLDDVIFQTQPVAVVGLSSGATALTKGPYAQHSCAIVSGAAKCWGLNDDGELGNGTFVDSSVPFGVSGLTSGVSMIATGASHTCAVVNSKAICWGGNATGQLGNGSTNDSATPVTAIGANVTAVSAGFAHSCAIVSGGVKCWGNNQSGELGNGSTSESNTPVSVQGLTGTAVSIAIGVAHTCAAMSTGKVQCWGYNSNGQLGNGTNTPTGTNPPATVSNIASGATAVAAGGYHTCAIVSGGVQCWGDGQAGQLGYGPLNDSFVPVAATGLSSNVSQISEGNTYSCAIASGTGYCWGDLHSLGGATSQFVGTPIALQLGATVTSIGTGITHGCAIAGGTVVCVGTDYFGELGDGRSIFLQTPGTVLEGDAIFVDGFESD
jgi:alpha-tubulin suppressor-like RCC1 family protein